MPQTRPRGARPPTVDPRGLWTAGIRTSIAHRSFKAHGCGRRASVQYCAGMGAWSAEPFGNDTTADWAWELDQESTWDLVLDALTGILEEDPTTVDAEDASVTIAAAEVVAHAYGKPTQSDEYTKSVAAFVERAQRPPAGIVDVALDALEIAAAPDGELAELWADGQTDQWAIAVGRLRANLEAVR